MQRTKPVKTSGTAICDYVITLAVKWESSNCVAKLTSSRSAKWATLTLDSTPTEKPAPPIAAAPVPNAKTGLKADQLTEECVVTADVCFAVVMGISTEFNSTTG